jgi:hypothetical protein
MSWASFVAKEVAWPLEFAENSQLLEKTCDRPPATPSSVSEPSFTWQRDGFPREASRGIRHVLDVNTGTDNRSLAAGLHFFLHTQRSPH